MYSTITESDLLEMLQEDDYISPIITTTEQYQLYTTCINRLNAAQQNLTSKQLLSEKIAKLSRRIEKHSDVLWCVSPTL